MGVKGLICLPRLTFVLLCFEHDSWVKFYEKKQLFLKSAGPTRNLKKKKKKLEIGWYECQTDVFYLEYFAGGLPHPKVNKKI